MRNIFVFIIGFLLLVFGMLSSLVASQEDDVHGRCIVQLKNNIDSHKVAGIARAFSVLGNASIKHVYKHSIKGFAINMPCHSAKAAFGDSELIVSMEPDAIITMFPKGDKKPPRGETQIPSQKISYGTSIVGGPVDGTGYTAWVIDTGVDLDHPDLNIDANDSRHISYVRGGPDDQNGHGTHVAGTIGAIDNEIGTLGVAPNTKIVSVRVLDRRGSGTLSGVIAGIDHVAALASSGDCVNLSLGGGKSQALDNSVIAASKSGAYFTIAAGNSSDDANFYSPASANGTNIYTISAIDENKNFAWFSNWGNPPIDYAAPGVNILSLWKDAGVNTISGTSMATPHACAVLMVTKGNPSTAGNAFNDPDSLYDSIIKIP